MSTRIQRKNRAALIDAAVEVMKRSGVGACTARAIAEVSPLSLASLHYYFADVDELIDLAVQQIFDGVCARIVEMADVNENPMDALWGAFSRYNTAEDAWTSRLWFEYMLICSRRGDTESMNRLSRSLVSSFQYVMTHAGVPAAEVEAKARLLFVASLGIAASASVDPDVLPVLLADFASALALPSGSSVRPS